MKLRETGGAFESQFLSQEKEIKLSSKLLIKNHNLFIVLIDHAKLIQECIEITNNQSGGKPAPRDFNSANKI